MTVNSGRVSIQIQTGDALMNKGRKSALKAYMVELFCHILNNFLIIILNFKAAKPMEPKAFATPTRSRKQSRVQGKPSESGRLKTYKKNAGAHYDAEDMLIYGKPVIMNCVFQQRNPSNNLPLNEPKELGILRPGNFLRGSVAVRKKQRHILGSVFIVMPAIELAAKKRIARQVKRITKYRAGNYSANRMDDNEEVKKNIQNLQREIQQRLASSKAAIGKPVRFGSSVNFVHLRSKQYLGVQDREQGCQSEFNEYVPLELCLRYQINEKNIFEILPFQSYQKIGNKIREHQAFVMKYFDAEESYSPLLSSELNSKASVPLSRVVNSYFHYENPVPTLTLKNLSFPSYVFNNLTGTAVLLKHREQDLFMTIMDVTKRSKIIERSHAFRAKVLSYRVQKGAYLLALTRSGFSDTVQAKRRNTMRKREEFLAVQLKEHQEIRASQRILHSTRGYNEREFDLFFVTKKTRLQNIAKLLWQVIPSSENPSQIYLYHISTAMLVGPLVGDFIGQQHKDLKENETIVCDLSSVDREKFTLEQSMTSHHFSRVRLIKETSSFHDPNSNVAFSLNIVQASLDLKVRYACQCHSSLWQLCNGENWELTKIKEANAVLSSLILFLSNSIPQLLSEDQELGSVSYTNQTILQDLDIIKNVLQMFRYMFSSDLNQTNEVIPEQDEDTQGSNVGTSPPLPYLEQSLSKLYHFLNLYIYQNPENSKDLFIYFLRQYLLHRQHFKHATLQVLILLKRTIYYAQKYFDYFESTFKDVGFLLIRNLHNSTHSIEVRVAILETLTLMADTLIIRGKVNLALKLFSYLVVDEPQETVEILLESQDDPTGYQIEEEQTLLVNMLHKHILGTERRSVDILCSTLNSHNEDYVYNQIKLYSTVQKLFNPTFENKHVSRTIKILKNYLVCGESKLKIKSSLIHLVNSILQKNEMLQLQAPCTVRFKQLQGVNERSFDVDFYRSKRLSEKNIQNIIKLDGNLQSSTSTATQSIFEEVKHKSYLRDKSEVDQCHLELISMYNTFAKICAAQHQPGIEFFYEQMLEKYYTFWNYRTPKRTTPLDPNVHKFPKLMEVEMKILLNEVSLTYAQMNKSCAFTTLPFINRSFTQSLVYLQQIKLAKQYQKHMKTNVEEELLNQDKILKEKKIPQRDLIIMGMCQFFKTMVLFENDTFLTMFNLLDPDVDFTSSQEDTQKETFTASNILKLIGHKMTLPLTNFKFLLLGNTRQLDIINGLAGWLEFAKFQTTKNEIFETAHVFASLRQTCVSSLKTALFLEFQQDNFRSFKSILQDVPQIDRILDTELQYWVGLEADLSEEDILRKCPEDFLGKKEKVLFKLKQLLQKIDEYFTEHSDVTFQTQITYAISSKLSKKNWSPEPTTPYFAGKKHTKSNNSLLVPLVKASEGSLFGKGSTGDVNNLATLQNFFREIGGHRTILTLIFKFHYIMTEAINMCYHTIAGEEPAIPFICQLTFQIFTLCYKIMRSFVKKNKLNIKELAPQIEDTLPYYGEMYMVNSILEESEDAAKMEEAIFFFQAAMFGEPSSIINDFPTMSRYINKLRTKIVNNKLRYLLKIYAKILRLTIEPRIIDLLINNLITLRASSEERETIDWEEVRHFLNKIKNSLDGTGFMRVIRKLDDFACYIKKENETVNMMRKLSSLAKEKPSRINLDTLIRPKEIAKEEEPEEKVKFKKIKRTITEYDFILEKKEHQHQSKKGKKQDRAERIIAVIKREKRECFEKLLIYRGGGGALQVFKKHMRKSKNKALAILPELLGSQAQSKKNFILTEMLKFMNSLPLETTAHINAFEFYTDQIQEIVDDFDTDHLVFRLIETASQLLRMQSTFKRDALVPGILRLSNKLLSSSSELIQQKFYEFFNVKSETNPLFTIHKLLLMTMNYIQIKKVLPFYLFRYKQTAASFHALSFLKMVCQNHNKSFQILMGDQKLVPSKSIDFVATCSKLLRTTLTTLLDYYPIQIDTRISLTKEIVIASERRSTINPTYSSQRKKKKQRNESFTDPKFSSDKKQRIQELLQCSEHSLSALIEFVQGPCPENQEKLVVSQIFKCTKLLFQKLKFTFKHEKPLRNQFNAYLLKLKGDCSLLIQSLLEGRQNKDHIAKAVTSQIFLRDIEFLLGYCYYAFNEIMGGNFLLDSQYFIATHKDFRLESAFNVFFMFLKMTETQNYKSEHSSHESPLFQEVHTSAERQLTKVSFFKSAGKFCRELCNCKSSSLLRPQMPLENLNKQGFLSRYKRFVGEGGRFFKENTCSIEVHHEQSGKLIAYFPKAPSYRTITDQQKQDFLYSLSTNDDYVKHDSIAIKGWPLMAQVTQEYVFKSSFLKYPFLGIIINYTDLWKNLGFYLSLIINFLILFSYTTEEDNSYDNPILFYEDGNETSLAITVLGGLFLFLTIPGQLPSASYRIPYHLAKYKSKQGRKKQSGCKKCLKITCSVATDLNLLYNVLYVIFACLGIFVHHFFFGFHLTSIITRSPDMRNILRAIYKSGRQSLLILTFFFIAEYLFSLIAFGNYADRVRRNYCVSLFSCFLTYIDQTFKNNGGVGGFMDQTIDPSFNLDQTSQMNFLRIIFDFSFNLIILIITIQLYAAVLIDTFSAMRTEKNNLEKLMHNNCLVCGCSRSLMETNGENFQIHTKKNHNIFNYIRFLAYLDLKNKDDYTGLESYVAEKNKQLDFSWIPQNFQ